MAAIFKPANMLVNVMLAWPVYGSHCVRPFATNRASRERTNEIGHETHYLPTDNSHLHTPGGGKTSRRDAKFTHAF